MTWKSIPPLTGMAWLLTQFFLAATASYPGLSTTLLAIVRTLPGLGYDSFPPK